MTVTLTRARVPAFLRSSDFFLSIEDDLDEFEEPTQCYKDDTTVSGISSLTLLLSTLRFWGSSHIPPSLIAFVIGHPHKYILPAVESFRGSLLFADFLIPLVALSLKIGNHTHGRRAYDSYVMCSSDVQEATAELCRYQIEQKYGSVWNEVTSALAEKFELTEVLQFLREHGCPRCFRWYRPLRIEVVDSP
jgi:hypothetical protein